MRGEVRVDKGGEREADSEVEGNAGEKESDELVSGFRGFDLLLDDAKYDLDHWQTIGG
jgi:hypothetical protein